MRPERYVGDELELFAAARRWKGYVRERVRPYLGGRVLEVGAGMGATTAALLPRPGEAVADWVCVEPDPNLARRIGGRIETGELPSTCDVVTGTVDDVPEAAFDTVLYVDVLEHIEDDRAEVDRAARRLRPGGHLVVLAPAHPFLYSPFDERIGHHRRYTRPTLRALIPPGLAEVESVYLDSAGLLASTANRLLLRSSMPTPAQIAFWDGVLVRVSRVLDPLLGNAVGKSVLAVWRREGPAGRAGEGG